MNFRATPNSSFTLRQGDRVDVICNEDAGRVEAEQLDRRAEPVGRRVSRPDRHGSACATPRAPRRRSRGNGRREARKRPAWQWWLIGRAALTASIYVVPFTFALLAEHAPELLLVGAGVCLVALMRRRKPKRSLTAMWLICWAGVLLLIAAGALGSTGTLGHENLYWVTLLPACVEIGPRSGHGFRS